ncbi:MAG: pitrilysin family protein [Pseudomonadota bacterium]|uniref:Insulinase family protein n=1 Tax=Alteromonas alba TaxID=2079529 RepID=A0A2S9VFJ5_9ALTE|nr:pitrilysin family protein [Alteromonas alba]MDY6925876.1 pitrilysin family protein [Pseudomonadota bacterium]PRO75230.1 insulinase family protein [Alteromonas alba]
MKLVKTLLASSLITVLTLSVNAKEMPPAGGTPGDFTVPATQEITLENGLKVTFIPYGSTPKATVRLVTNTGNIDDGEKAWLADLSFDMLRQGTATQSAKALAEAVASMGGEIATSVGMDSSFIGMDVLGEFTPDAVGVLADMVMNASFAEADLTRLKTDSQRNLAVQKSSPSAIATEAFYQSIYGNHPYGRLYPTADSLAALTVDDTKTFISSNVVPNRSHLYVSGVFDQAAVRKAVKAAFAEWQAGEARATKTVLTKPGPTLELIEREGAPQSTLRLGLATVDATHPDYTKLSVMNTLLGGAFSSRITANIREDKGYTYSPRSAVVDRLGSAVWYEGADVTAEATGASLVEIFKEIELLASEAPTTEELKGVQNYMAGIFVLRNSSRSAIISQLAFLELHGLDKTYLTDYVQNVHGVTPEEVSNMAKKYLDNASMHLTIVGDTATVTPQLKEVKALEAYQ